jgi:hypothetical protein
VTDDLNESALWQETPEQAASRIIREAAPFAATAISELVNDASISPSVRLAASKYVTDRILGPVGKDTETDKLEDFFREIAEEANRGQR